MQISARMSTSLTTSTIESSIERDYTGTLRKRTTGEEIRREGSSQESYLHGIASECVETVWVNHCWSRPKELDVEG